MEYNLDKNEFRLEHNLNPYFDEIKSFKTRKDYENSDLYKKHGKEIRRIEDGIEWKNDNSFIEQKDVIKVVAWNVERGKELEGIIHLFKTNEILSKADIIMLTETDIGMGRSGNYNVPLEIANALKMNYCFATSFLVLAKGDSGEQDHTLGNTLSLHGTVVLSKFKIVSCQAIPLYRVKDTFFSPEKRLGQKKGLICKIKIGNYYYDFISLHFDMSSSPKQRAMQMESILKVLATSKSKAKLIGGDFNTSTYNVKTKFRLFINVLYKVLILGMSKTMPHFMAPEIRFEKPLFDILNKYGFDADDYNDKTKGTFVYDIDNTTEIEKIRKFLPNFIITWINNKLKPYDGRVILRLDWITGQGFKVVKEKKRYYSPPQVIENLLWENKPVSDHNPIIVDLILES